ncbi:DUF397 domain-containing protein [Amycolatopsis sp. NPDC058278]|uniref:DUF397 domain-containing protein n=1 Tax=Amycolatopsis sp. NPDC058278 TaxID=3346417 RepID=UPI0036DE2AE3
MSDVTWRKSSHSGEETNCVEVRLAGLSQIRDTKTARAAHSPSPPDRGKPWSPA